MRTEINYNGITIQPANNIAPDGDLETSVNLINENNSIVNIKKPLEINKLIENTKIISIHHTSEYKHYIIHRYEVQENSTVIHNDIWATDENLNKIGENICTNINSKINSVAAIGNTIVINTSEGMEYAIYKEDKYQLLGKKPPMTKINFSLSGEFKQSDRKEKIEFEERGLLQYDGPEAERLEKNNTYILGMVNTFIAEAQKKGTFIFPFFVRYAYKMYDGTHTMHSAPVLMIPNSKNVPYIAAYNYSLGPATTRLHCFYPFIAATCCKLEYFFVNDGSGKICVNNDTGEPVNNTELDIWKDIIKGIDIFISAPIYTYDKSEKITEIKFLTTEENQNEFSGISLSSITNAIQGRIGSTTAHLNKERDFWGTFTLCNLKAINYDAPITGASSQRNGINIPYIFLTLPSFKEQTMKEKIEQTSLFYKVKSIQIEEIKKQDGRKTIEFEENYLKNLQTKQTLNDDYQSHNNIKNEVEYVYNNKLNIADIKQKAYIGYPTDTMFQFQNRNQENTFNERTAYETYVYIRKNGKTIIIKTNHSQPIFGAPYNKSDTEELKNTATSFPRFVFYPDTDAYRMILFRTCDAAYADINLKQHELLNGAFFFAGLELKNNAYNIKIPNAKLCNDLNITYIANSGLPEYDTLPKTTENNWYAEQSKMFSSTINNPFVFPANSRNTVGNGKIIAICSATQALSQGQFGQFPLYAFTSQGVWAIEINADGTFSTKQPATRDVLLSKNAILQIDGAIAFCTERGLMILQGVESLSISERIGGEKIKYNFPMPNFSSIIKAMKIEDKQFTYIPFLQFIQNCKMAYDYVNSRIIITNKTQPYSYIYSLKYKNWGVLSQKFIDTINDYPTSLIVGDCQADNKMILYNACKEDRTKKIDGFIITRPIKIQGYEQFTKTIKQIIQRGVFKKGNVSFAIYGSNDGFNLHYVTSSIQHIIYSIHGTPYKYFIFVIHTTLEDGESLSGASIIFEVKRNNKLR
ncbi:MAG: hypothetical protein RR280_08730 [Bacteroidaceae bacterium]